MARRTSNASEPRPVRPGFRKSLVQNRRGLLTSPERGLDIGQQKIATEEQPRVLAVAEKFRRAVECGPRRGRVAAS